MRMAILIKTRDKYWWGCGEKGTLVHCWWKCKLLQPLWKSVWGFLKQLKIELPYDPEIPRLVSISKENEISVLKGSLHSHVLCGIIRKSQPWKQLKGSTDGWMGKNISYARTCTHTLEYYFTIKPVIATNAGKPGGHYTKWNNPDTERLMLYVSPICGVENIYFCFFKLKP